MKRLLFTTSVVLFTIVHGFSQCTHTIVLSETYGDGWNDGGSLLEVAVNGVPAVSNMTILNGSTTASYTFSANTGDIISVYLTVDNDPFFAADASSIEVFDGNMSSLGTGVPALLPTVLNFVADCSAAPTCNNPTIVDSDDWENTNVDPWLIPGTVYHNTPQTFGPNTGSRHLYLNFVNGFTGLAYSRTVSVCPDSLFEISCWMHDTWGGVHNVTLDVWDGATLLNSQTFSGSGPYFQYTSGLLSASSSTVTWNLTNNSSTIGNNDFALDDFAVTTCDCNPLFLPVELIEFNANCELIYWRTASESNSSHYRIEEFVDGENWTQVGEDVLAKENSDTEQFYSVEHRSNTASYFRLTQFDLDGEFEEIGITAVSCAPGAKTLIGVYNMMGQKVSGTVAPGRGIYILRYSDGSQVRVMR